jgi:pyruvate/2-oxoglutarate dehydrogenase complex dihydrolipoamide acyltransferase (E2) component
MIQRKGLDINKISASGRNGRVLKEDVLKYIESGKHEQDKKQIKEQPMQPVQKPDAQSSFSSSHKIAKLTGIKDTDK